MIYDNNEITAITYSGYNIVRVYSCGGEVVFGEEPTPPPTPTGGTKLTCLNNSGNTYTLECDGNGTINRTEWVDDYWDKYKTGVRYTVTDVIIGDCVTTVGTNAFQQLEALTAVTIPRSVTTFGTDSFAGTAIHSIFIHSGVTDMGTGAFEQCNSLSNITFEQGLTTIGNAAFYNCIGLTNVTIPSSVTAISSTAFDICNNLASVTVLATTPPTLSDWPFESVSPNLIIYVPAESLQAYQSAPIWSNHSNKLQAIQ